jgi:hypothetical protein
MTGRVGPGLFATASTFDKIYYLKMENKIIRHDKGKEYGP